MHENMKSYIITIKTIKVFSKSYIKIIERSIYI